MPHVTLGRVPDDKLHLTNLLINEIAESFHAFSLEICNIECRDEPYQKLVLTLNTGRKFRSICQRVDHFFKGNYSKPSDPHISLLYSHLHCDQIFEKTKYISQHSPENAKICEIAAIELQGGPDKWNILARKKFQDY